MDYMTMNFNRNGGSGTSDYSQLSNKPQINGVTLNGNKTSADLGLMQEYEVDDTPTELSENLITSGAVWNKLQGSKQASSIGGTIAIPDYGTTESIEMYFKPSQDLHGYSKPWAGGAGKNKLVYPYDTETKTESDVTFTVYNDGTIKANGTATSDITIGLGKTYISDNDFTFSGITSGSVSTYYLRFVARDSEGAAIPIEGQVFIDVYTIETTKTLPANTSYVDTYLGVKNGTTLSNITFEPMIRLATETDPTFEPYSNICPIVGQSEATFSWTDSQDIETARTMNFGNTYYGGVCQFDGTIYPDWDYIASYNGETLTGEWLSDRDEYTAGTTPTNGAEVVYKTTPTQVRVTPPANLNLTDDYPIEYNGYMANIVYQPKDTVLEEAKNYTNQKIGELVPQVYSTSEEKVGTWIDGTPIYQRTVNFGSLPNATTKTVLTDILAEDIIQINVVANTKTATGVGYKNIIQNIPNGYVGGGDITFIAKIDTNNKIEINITTGSDRTAYNGYVTIQYTKPSN